MKKRTPITRQDFWKGIIAAVLALVILVVLNFTNSQITGSGKDASSYSTTSTEAASAEGAEGSYIPGEYTASELGFGGPVELTMTVGQAGGIESVKLVGEAETPEVGGAALETLQQQILDAQGPEIDGVSGASLTSGAAKAAAEKACAAARGEAAPGPTGHSAAPASSGSRRQPGGRSVPGAGRRRKWPRSGQSCSCLPSFSRRWISGNDCNALGLRSSEGAPDHSVMSFNTIVSTSTPPSGIMPR